MTIKRTNNDKGLNHKWAMCAHFDFSIKRIFLATFFKKYVKFPNKFHYLYYYFLNKYEFFKNLLIMLDFTFHLEK